MTTFILCSAALVLISLVFLVRPLWLARSDSSARRDEANLAIIRSQMAELEREFADGSLGAEERDAARTELQRRLLSEAQPGTATTLDLRPSHATAAALMLLLPVLAVGGYLWLGKPQALDPAAVERPQQVTAAQIEGMVAGLAKRLQDNPGDTQGWLMLARSYKALDRLPEAAEAYAKVEAEVNKNPDLLTDYAEILATVHQSFQGKPAKLVEQAIKLDPQHPRGLLLAGVVAMEKKDYKTTIMYWERLLPLVAPGSEAEAMIKGGLEKLRKPQSPAK